MEAIHLETGKRYILRSGKETSILKLSNNGTNYKFSADVQEDGYKTKSVLSWKVNGRFLTNTTDHKNDIIREVFTAEQASENIILLDKMLNKIEKKTVVKYCNIYQEDKPHTTIIKYVYLKHNEAFNNKAQKTSPKCKCKFDLHTDKKSSFVTIYNRKSEVIYNGNFLHTHGSSKTEKEHLKSILLLHSVKNVVENYGGNFQNLKL